MTFKFTKNNIAVFIALLFHVSGAIGILLTPYANWFIGNTSLNLLLMVGLLIWTQTEKNLAFFGFMAICFVTGMGVEMIGVNTGRLFGSYQYGTVMGPKINGVPWLIGLNWFVLIFASGIVMTRLHDWIKEKSNSMDLTMSPLIEKFSLLIDGALLASFFDWIMEPVAIKLKYWNWKTEEIPDFNYFTWFVVSLVLLFVFTKLQFNKRNHFAIDLLIIQASFFLTLRNFL